MSGYRGTIGNPDRDPVAAWIYDHVEGVDTKRQNRVFKLANEMRSDSLKLKEIADRGLRERMAKLLRIDRFAEIDRVFGDDSALCHRLKNLAVRGYRQSLGLDRESRSIDS